MKLVSIAKTFLFLVVPVVSSTALGECKSICKEIRPDVLAVKGHCMPAMKQSPTPNLFNACVEGRKKAFDQACIPICTKSEVSVTSFQGCQTSVKNKGHKFVSWCRKGYDSILQNLEAALSERLESTKQEEMKNESDEEVGVQDERELIQTETVAIEEPEVSESEPLEVELVHVGPTQFGDEPKVVADEAKSGLRGAIDEPEGSESVNDDIVLFEHKDHEKEDTNTVAHMEDDGASLEINASKDETVFEL